MLSSFKFVFFQVTKFVEGNILFVFKLDALYKQNTTEAFFGGPSCLTTKWLFANMTSYSVYPSEERYVGYAMASGTYGKSGWSQTKFLIASIGLNTNTSFAGKASPFISLRVSKATN